MNYCTNLRRMVIGRLRLSKSPLILRGWATLVILLVLAFIGLSFTALRYHSVKYIYDGDTILIDTGDAVRYLGINAPEIGHEGKKSQFMAHDARDFNIHLVGGSRVRIELDREETDHYGRLLAYVFLKNGDMVNALIVKKGFAHVMVKDSQVKYFKLLMELQRQAMNAKLGIWTRKPEKKERYYLGNKSSFRFHRPGCLFASRILPKNLVKVKNYQDAFWMGFSPCKRCNP